MFMMVQPALGNPKSSTGRLKLELWVANELDQTLFLCLSDDRLLINCLEVRIFFFTPVIFIAACTRLAFVISTVPSSYHTRL